MSGADDDDDVDAGEDDASGRSQDALPLVSGLDAGCSEGHAADEDEEAAS